MRILSWNVNGIRAAIRNGFKEWLESESADIICLQEVKASLDQFTESYGSTDPLHITWNEATRPGYSGVANINKKQPLSTQPGFGIDEFDNEGRIILQEFENFYLYNIYFPNGKKNDDRLDYKLRFYNAFLDHAENLRKTGKAVIACGDYNTAHKAIDLKNPKANEKFSGFLPIERAWMDKLVETGYVDTFRMFNREPEQYSWWTYRMNARKRNIGWRIDYFFIDEEHKSMVKNAFIMNEITGSDHCPVGIELEA
ncbi:MAG: exodeoxyribonuclease III [Calditrichaceae bacterium]|jgi:exodeoxyribonuclease-3